MEYRVDPIEYGHGFVVLCSVVVILPGPRLNLKTVFPGMGISIRKIRWL